MIYRFKGVRYQLHLFKNIERELRVRSKDRLQRAEPEAPAIRLLDVSLRGHSSQ
jgi:hypothetical protein